MLLSLSLSLLVQIICKMLPWVSEDRGDRVQSRVTNDIWTNVYSSSLVSMSKLSKVLGGGQENKFKHFKVIIFEFLLNCFFQNINKILDFFLQHASLYLMSPNFTSQVISLSLNMWDPPNYEDTSGTMSHYTALLPHYYTLCTGSHTQLKISIFFPVFFLFISNLRWEKTGD